MQEEIGSCVVGPMHVFDDESHGPLVSCMQQCGGDTQIETQRVVLVRVGPQVVVDRRRDEVGTHLAQRPESCRDRKVGNRDVLVAHAQQGQAAAVAHVGQQLVYESRLTDARFARHQRQARCSPNRVVEEPVQEREFVNAADKRGVDR